MYKISSFILTRLVRSPHQSNRITDCVTHKPNGITNFANCFADQPDNVTNRVTN